MPSAAFISTDYALHHDPPVPNGCTWMRCVLPGQALTGLGWSVALGLPRDHPELGIGVAHEDGALFGFDVYVYKLLLHQSTPDEFAKMRARGDRVVVDVDDFHFQIADSNIAARMTSPLHSPDNNRMWHEVSMRVADRLTVSTDFLASHYERRCRDVVVVRNALDTARFAAVEQPQVPVFGWVGGTPWRSGDIELLADWLPGFVGDFDLSVHHAGHIPGDPGHFAARAGLRRVSTSLNCSMDQYPSLLSGFHVGLVPLARNPFNEAKCLYPGSMICTNKGMIRADQIKNGDLVHSVNGWRAVVAVEKTETRAGLEFVTKTGRSLTVTPEHRLWVNGDWREATSIEVGDTLQAVELRCSEGPMVTVPWPSQSRRTRGGVHENYESAESVPRVTIDERWGRFLGLFAGDGSCSGKTATTISCDGVDQDLIDLIMDDLTQMGMSPGTEQVRTWDGQVIRRRHVRVASAHLSQVLVSMGVAQFKGQGTTAKRVVCVPDVIFRSPERVVCQFISGLFEADGTVTSTGVSLSTIHGDFARQVQMLLAMVGIQSRIRFRSTSYVHKGIKKQGRGVYQVTLARASADIFDEKVGFLSSRKRSKLDAVVSRPHSNAYRPMSWGDDPVISITQVDVESPIDLQVIGQEYTANGVRSHNSFLKGLEYAAAGIPFIASPTEEYRLLAEAGVGRLAETPDEWRDHATALLDRDVRVEEADRQRRIAQEQFDVSTMGEAWATALLG